MLKDNEKFRSGGMLAQKHNFKENRKNVIKSIFPLKIKAREGIENITIENERNNL